MKMVSFIFFLVITNSVLVYSQSDSSTCISSSQMAELESILNKFYTKYNIPPYEFKAQNQGIIKRDSSFIENKEDAKYDSVSIFMTEEFFIAFAKSIKEKAWHLAFLHSESEFIFKEFGFDEHTTLNDVSEKYDSTDSYATGNEEHINSIGISFPDTEDFIFFREFAFYFQNDSLYAISLEVHENR